MTLREGPWAQQQDFLDGNIGTGSPFRIDTEMCNEGKKKVSINESPFYLKLEWVDTVSKVVNTVKELRRQNEIAVDCKGNNLGRVGSLDILTIGTLNRKVFLFDIAKLGSHAFDFGLRELLESENMTKLMYDCRNDSDALAHLYKVKLAGVLDLQLVELDKRPKFKRRNGKKFPGLKSLRESFDEYIDDDKTGELKERVSEQIWNAQLSGATIWDKRPLDTEFENYCAVDTVKLFTLQKVFKKKMDKDRMLEATRERIVAMG